MQGVGVRHESLEQCPGLGFELERFNVCVGMRARKLGHPAQVTHVRRYPIMQGRDGLDAAELLEAGRKPGLRVEERVEVVPLRLTVREDVRIGRIYFVRHSVS